MADFAQATGDLLGDAPTAIAGAPNTNDEISQILRLVARMVTKRKLWEPIFDDCYKFALPARARFDQTTVGRDNAGEIFDSTAVNSTPEFASRLQSGIVPPGVRFAKLVAGLDVPENQREDINRQLGPINDEIFRAIRDSNFSTAVAESFHDIAIGTAALIADPGDAVQVVNFTSVPLTNLLIKGGPWGVIETMARERRLELRDAFSFYETGTFSPDMIQAMHNKPEAMCDFVEITWRDRSLATERWQYRVIAKKFKHMVDSDVFDGQGSNPWMVYRWTVASGEDWGRGPLMNALPDIKTLNLVQELTLENAEIAIAGMWQTDDEQTINSDNIQLVPGTIVPKRPGSNGLEPLESPSNFDVGRFVTEELQTSIKHALFDDMLGPVDDPVKSATEINVRRAELARRIGAAYGRLINEMVRPVVIRVAQILRLRGVIDLPEIDGRFIDIVVTSPLANSQADEEILALDRYLEQLNLRFGARLTQVAVKAEEAARFLGKQHGIDPALLRNEQEARTLAEQMGQMAGEAAAAGMDPAAIAGATQSQLG